MSTALRRAAVLVPLVLDAPGGPSLVFIVRTKHGPHGGQVAFPGGVREAADPDAAATALREFEEELGVSRAVVELVETCPEMLTISTGFQVTPVIGRIPSGLSWRPDAREVADVFDVPLVELTRPENRREIDVLIREGSPPRRFPAIEAAGHTIWGLTYRILERVLPRLA
jgi:8-oxo-dGTP pyrophosphatase MutT (NUDIX family)